MLVILAVIGFVPAAYAAPTVDIIMEQTTYSYCEKLHYTIKVSEVSENLAIIHIRDSMGTKSSAIPISITDYENHVPSRVPFDKDVFPLGDYFVDVEYEGQKTTAMFTLVDSGKRCLSDVLKTITANWIGGYISDGFLIDAFERHADKEIIDIPFEITEQNINDIHIPFWVKNAAYWWIAEDISDYEFSDLLKYLMENKVISN